MSDGSAGGWAPHPDARAPGHQGRAEVGDRGEMLDADSPAVVGLGAICGLDEGNPSDADRALRCWVSEFALLADGRRIVLHEERGFTIGPLMGPGRHVGPRRLSREQIVDTVLNVVLPDDEEPTEEHPFDWLASLGRQRGLWATPEELRDLPYEVILSADLARHLAVY